MGGGRPKRDANDRIGLLVQWVSVAGRVVVNKEP